MATRGAFTFLISLVTIVFLALVVMLYLSNPMPASIKSPLFKQASLNSTAPVLQIALPGWTYITVWVVTFTWQFAWIIYGWLSLCRRTMVGYLCSNPGVLPGQHYTLFLFACAFYIGWLFLWDRQLYHIGTAFMGLAAILLHIALGFAARRLYKIGPILQKLQLRSDLVAARLLVHNGLAMFTAWTVVATMWNLATSLVFYKVTSDELACTIVLSILSLYMLVWFLVDIFGVEKQLRYVITPYLLVIFVFATATAKNWNLIFAQNLNVDARNPVFMLSILAGSVLLLFCKIILMAVLSARSPLHKNKA